MASDDGNLYVLEGVLVGLLLLGAAYAVGTLQQSSVEAIRPRTELQRLLGDGLTVLTGLDDGNGTHLLDHYLAEALHCAEDAVRSEHACYGTRGSNLSLKLENYLPPGAGYAIGLGNGAAVREIYRAPVPQGEAVAVSRTIGLAWNLTFVATELSCYASNTDAHATLIPIDRGALAPARWANVTLGSAEIAGETADTSGWWNVTLPAATRPATGTLSANTTALGSSATLRGTSGYGSCAIGASQGALVEALRNVRLSAASDRVAVGSTIQIEADLAPLAAVGTVGDAIVVMHAPAPPRADAPDTWILAGTVPLEGATTRTGEWRVRDSALYGAHVALLRIPMTVDGVEVEVRKPLVIHVALATGEIPIDAPYRVTLQAWLPDWA